MLISQAAEVSFLSETQRKRERERERERET